MISIRIQKIAYAEFMASEEQPVAAKGASVPKALTKNPLGASGKAVAVNVRRLIKEQRLTFAELSERLAKVGRQIPPLGLRKIVAETRRVDADDLVALAVALKVSPATLLMPEVSTAGPRDRVTMTGTDPSGPPVQIPARAVWEWLTAEKPIVPTMDFLEFGSRSWPKWVRDEVQRQIRDDEKEQDEALDRLEDQLMGRVEKPHGDD